MRLRAIPSFGLAALLAAAPVHAADCPRGTLTGQVTHVRDGDTIVVGSIPIRLNGLAAPEGDEPGGAIATQAMIELVQGRALRCELDGERTHDRCVGVCYLDGEDISEVICERRQINDLADARRANVSNFFRSGGVCRDRTLRFDPAQTSRSRPEAPARESRSTGVLLADRLDQVLELARDVGLMALEVTGNVGVLEQLGEVDVRSKDHHGDLVIATALALWSAVGRPSGRVEVGRLVNWY